VCETPLQVIHSFFLAMRCRPTTLDAVLYGHVAFGTQCRQPVCELFASLWKDPASAPVANMCQNFGAGFMGDGVEFLGRGDLDLDTLPQRIQSGVRRGVCSAGCVVVAICLIDMI
jgi:hypothetical protein